MNDALLVRLAEVSRRHDCLTTLRRMIETWDERKHFRSELEQMLRANPHLIDDIGLTRRQVEAEIAVPSPRARHEWWHRG